MEPAWDPVILNSHQVRPGQRRGRLASEHVDRHPQMYYQDGNGLLVPAAAGGLGRMRASSVTAPQRPAQIVINNEFDNHSPQGSPRRPKRYSHGHDYHYEDYSDDSFDDRAYSPHRHRTHSRRPSRHHRSPTRSPSPNNYYKYENEGLKARLEDVERREHAKEEEKRARERWEEEQLIEEARRVKKKKDEEAFKKKVIEENKIKEMEERVKEVEAKKKADEEYKKRVRKDMEKAGYDEEEIEKILKGKERAHHGGHGGHGHGGHGEMVMDLARPTYIRVQRKHLSPETLDIYNLPWDRDEVSDIPLILFISD